MHSAGQGSHHSAQERSIELDELKFSNKKQTKFVLLRPRLGDRIDD
jgi:hypothetical protein